MSDVPPVQPQQFVNAPEAHRGVMILVFGILGLLICGILGIIAWVMANGDLRKMDQGIMDPQGRGLTQAGKVLGIVTVCLNCIGILIWIIFAVFAVGATAAGVSAASGG